VKVAVLAGGRSSEREVSLSSGAAVCRGLVEAGHEPLLVHIEADGRWHCEGETVTLEPGGGLLGCDVVFPALHGPFGEDGTVQGVLETLDIPYVGSGVLASAVCMNKFVFKELMRAAGLPQVRYVALRADQSWDVDLDLGWPVFVKPARLGSSVGISRVASREELVPALERAFRHDSLVLVEQAAQGIEVECGVLGDGDPLVSPCGEIRVRRSRTGFYDYEAKYTPGGMELVVPARISREVAERVRELAREAFLRAGCSGLARVDFFVEDADGEGRVLLNEVNTMPGFTPTSVFARLVEAAGVSYPELCDRLVALALARFRRERALAY